MPNADAKCDTDDSSNHADTDSQPNGNGARHPESNGNGARHPEPNGNGGS